MIDWKPNENYRLVKVLINHSNHSSINWDIAQKEDWDQIVDIPFPNIPADWDEFEVQKLAEKNAKEILKLIDNLESEIEDDNTIAEFYIMLQGEFSYCYMLRDILKKKLLFLNFAIPTTERIVEIKEDGTKISKFKFVTWRIFY